MQTACENLTEPERKALAQFVDRIRTRFGAGLGKVMLFGSKARGAANPDSDIDVLVLLEDSRLGDEVISEAFSVGLETGVFLSVLTISAAHFEETLRLGLPFARNVSQEGIAV